MLETIANNARGESSFLSTPRSIMPGSWVCDSPRVDTPKRPISLDGKQDLSIEIPRLDDPNDSRAEQRDAPDSEEQQKVGGETPSALLRENPGDAGTPDTPRDNRFECDYDQNPSELFLNLQRKEWDKAAGRANNLNEMIEARTWVSRKEKHGKLRWRLLPLHAAIIFKAPEKVVEHLLAAYPKGAQSKDDQGMLPLHLAFRHGSSEATVNLLLVAFPQSVDIKDRKGRIPLMLAQASASANRDAFVRALERGPTYYAAAAAATERAAATAEQRAMFDAKLIEVEKKHQQDISILKEERNGLAESVEILQKELAKQKGATQVLVDHVNALEQQLRSKVETERFLAVKAATLDTDLKEVCQESESQVQSLATMVEVLTKENDDLGKENESLMNELKQAIKKDVDLSAENEELKKEKEEFLRLCDGKGFCPDEFKYIKDKACTQERELKSLKMDWASAQARAAVLEAQLKSKIENEHELASQVSHLAGKLAESAADNNAATDMYSQRVQLLEEERERLRATINDLGKKLLKVSHFMNKITQKTQENTKRTTEEARQKQAKLLEDASNHEQLIRTALAERMHMAELLKKQEEEMERSARQHQEILNKLAELRRENAEDEVEGEEPIPFSNSLTEEMREMMDNVLRGMPHHVPSSDSDLVETGVDSATPDNRMRSMERDVWLAKASVTEQDIDSSSSSDADEDPHKCLEEALRVLELSRMKSASEQQLTSMSEVSDASLNYNPSDEASEAYKRGLTQGTSNCIEE